MFNMIFVSFLQLLLRQSPKYSPTRETTQIKYQNIIFYNCTSTTTPSPWWKPNWTHQPTVAACIHSSKYIHPQSLDWPCRAPQIPTFSSLLLGWIVLQPRKYFPTHPRLSFLIDLPCQTNPGPNQLPPPKSVDATARYDTVTTRPTQQLPMQFLWPSCLPITGRIGDPHVRHCLYNTDPKNNGRTSRPTTSETSASTATATDLLTQQRHPCAPTNSCANPGYHRFADTSAFHCLDRLV